MDVRTILFDFDGVLCADRFYEKALLPGQPGVYDWIQENIFRGDKDLVGKWMRGGTTFAEINRLIAGKTGLDAENLERLFLRSVKAMSLDAGLLSLVSDFRRAGLRIGLVTDNMDIFTKVTVPHHRLGRLFDAIVNSADYGLLKKDEGGRLYDLALERLGEDDIGLALAVDDSESTIEMFRGKGGHGWHYTGFESFRAWAGGAAELVKRV